MSMQSSFKAYHICRDMESHGSVMDMRIGIMGHMVASLMVGKGQIEMSWLEMVDSWIHLIGEVVDMSSTLIWVQKCIMVYWDGVP